MNRYTIHYEISWRRKFDDCWAARTYVCEAEDKEAAINKFWRTHRSGNRVSIDKVEQNGKLDNYS